MATVTLPSLRSPNGANNHSVSAKIETTDSDIIGSKLLAKCVFEYNGKIYIVAVFERSEYYRFFFVFTAKTRRTPRKNWQYTKIRHGVYGGATNYLSLEDFMKHSVYRECAYKVTYTRPIKKRDYLIWHRRIANPLENRTPAVPKPGEYTGYAAAVTSHDNKGIQFHRHHAIKRYNRQQEKLS